MAMIGPVISPIAFLVASAGLSSGCSCITRSTFSTTTMASSTTMPMARTSASRETVLAEKPSASITAKVPMSDTGTAMIGTRVARALPRKTNTTMATSTKASTSVWITSFDGVLHEHGRVVDHPHVEIGGKAALQALWSALSIPSATATALEPGAW